MYRPRGAESRTFIRTSFSSDISRRLNFLTFSYHQTAPAFLPWKIYAIRTLLGFSRANYSIRVETRFLRRLRDKLLLDDRFILAVEVSTKSHLDPNVVWSSWGMACLKAGQYEAAREKFGHCFNVRFLCCMHRFYANCLCI